MGKSLDEILSKIKQNESSENNDSSSQSTELQQVGSIKGVVIADSEERKKLNLIDKIKANSLQSQKQLEAQEIIFDTQISQLKDRSEAIKRQSKTYWDTKSVAFAEALKTYSQYSMAELENERSANKISAITIAMETAYNKIEEIHNKPLPDVIKESLISEIMKVMDETVKRIKEDILAERYNLGPNND